ncbi:hypothetical protein CRX72_01985 [Pantoea sp. BRM17]|nr:hypothetical protein CRX72_01985 [Pantoea sp. BRM17]
MVIRIETLQEANGVLSDEQRDALMLTLVEKIRSTIDELVVHPLRDISRELQELPPQAILTHKLTLPGNHRDDEIGMLIRSYNRNQQVLESVHDEMSRLTTHFAELPVQITLPLYAIERGGMPKPIAYLVLQADSSRVYQFLLSTLSTMITTWLLMALILSVAISWCINRVAHTVRQPLSEAVLKADIPQAEHILNTLKPAGILSRADVVLPNAFQALHADFAPEKPVPRLVARLLFRLLSLRIMAALRPGEILLRVSRSLTIKQMAAVSAVVLVTITIFIVIQLFHFVQQRRVDYAQQMENPACSY